VPFSGVGEFKQRCVLAARKTSDVPTQSGRPLRKQRRKRLLRKLGKSKCCGMRQDALAVQAERRIYLIRGQRVMLAFELAELY
jgi:hypothetical protein